MTLVTEPDGHEEHEKNEAVASEEAAIRRARQELYDGPRCVAGCACQCNRTLCGCFDGQRWDRRVARNEMELALLDFEANQTSEE